MKKLFFILLILVFSGCSTTNGPVVDKNRHYDSTDQFGMFLYDILSGNKKWIKFYGKIYIFT